jgi:hypothetical protein
MAILNTFVSGGISLKAAGTTLSDGAGTDAPSAIGDVVIVSTSSDNASASTPTIAITQSGSGLATLSAWTYVVGANGNASAGNSAQVNIAYATVTAAGNIGILTATFSPSITAKAMRYFVFSGVGVVTSESNSGSFDPTFAGIYSGSGANTGDAALVALAVEAPDSDWVSYTNNPTTGWTANRVSTISGGAASNVCLDVGFHTSLPGGSAEYASDYGTAKDFSGIALRLQPANRSISVSDTIKPKAVEYANQGPRFFPPPWLGSPGQSDWVHTSNATTTWYSNTQPDDRLGVLTSASEMTAFAGYVVDTNGLGRNLVVQADYRNDGSNVNNLTSLLTGVWSATNANVSYTNTTDINYLDLRYGNITPTQTVVETETFTLPAEARYVRLYLRGDGVGGYWEISNWNAYITDTGLGGGTNISDGAKPKSVESITITADSPLADNVKPKVVESVAIANAPAVSDLAKPKIAESVLVENAVSLSDSIKPKVSESIVTEVAILLSDSAKPKAAESITITVNAPVSDLVKPKIADVVSVDTGAGTAVPTSDAAKPKVVDSATIEVSISLTDTASPKAVELLSAPASVSLTDTLLGKVSESVNASTGETAVPVSDGLAPKAVESITVAVSVAVTDTAKPKTAEVFAVPTVGLALSDTSRPKAVDAAVVAASIPVSDSAKPKSVESASVAIGNIDVPVSEQISPKVTESITISVSIPVSDQAKIKTSESMNGIPGQVSIKFHNGSSFVAAVAVKSWDGNSWVTVSGIKKYDGSTWV